MHSRNGAFARSTLCITAWLVSCQGTICDSAPCTGPGETVRVNGIPSSGHPWSVTVCTDTSDCASGTVDVYQTVGLAESGDASAGAGNASLSATTTMVKDSKIDLTVSVSGDPVTDGRRVHVVIQDAAGNEVTSVDHVVQLAPTQIGGSNCPVTCPESGTTKQL